MNQKRYQMFYLCFAALIITAAASAYGARSTNQLLKAVEAPADSQQRTTAESEKTSQVRELDASGLKNVLKRSGSASRPLLVTFWATWCEPCRQEFPDLVKIDSDYNSKGLEFITVSLDDLADINKGVPEYLRQMHAAMPAYLLNVSDPDTIIAAVDPKWDGGLPATFLYNGSGEVVFRHVGRIKPAELRAALDQQLRVTPAEGHLQ